MLNNSLVDKPVNTSAASSLDRLVSRSQHVFCHYVNQTRQVHIICINCSSFSFERVVFPQQHFLFKAPQEAHLEVYTSEIVSAVLLDRIPCDQLHVSITIDSPSSQQEVN